MALFWRIWLSLFLVTAAVLGLFVALSVIRFDAIHAFLLGERLVILAERTAAPFERAARLGLPVSAVRDAEGLLERARQSDEAIVALQVLSPEGTLLHATGDPSARMQADGRGRAHDRDAWTRRAGDGFRAGVTIDGPVAPAGEIQLTYPAERHTTRVSAMASELALVAIGVLVLAGLAGALLVRGLLNREIRGFAGVEAAIAAFERDAWRTAAGARVPVGGQEREMELRHMLEAAETRYRQAGRALAQSE